MGGLWYCVPGQPDYCVKALGASVRIFDILDRKSEVTDGDVEPLGFEGGEFLKLDLSCSGSMGVMGLSYPYSI